jgi:DNA invertase Pin-like site-specific DNA recombinase
MAGKRKRAVGYIRVSTDRQAEEGFGLEAQTKAIQDWCEREHLFLVQVEADEGESGSNGLTERHGLARAVAALQDGTAVVLVVARLDRLARDVVLQEQLLRDVLWPLGARVVSTADGEAQQLTHDPADPSRKLIRMILGAVAEYEREMIGLRMLAGKERKARSGGYAGGRPRYGTRAEGKALVPDEGEAQVLARVRQLRGEGASYRAICAALEADGLTTRGGGPWQPAVVRNLALRA